MIETIKEFQDLLAGAIHAQEIVSQIGTVKHDPGAPMSIEVDPSSPNLRSVTIARDPDTGSPFLLTLTPAPAERPALSTLEALFGPCRRVRTGLGAPASCIIDPARSYPDCSIAMILAFPVPSPGEEPLVHSIALRRDSAAVEDEHD